MKTVSSTCGDNLSQIKVSVEDFGDNDFTKVREHLKSGKNVEFKQETDVNRKHAVEEFEAMFGEKITNKISRDRVLDKIYVGGKKYCEMCGFDVEKCHPDLLMGDIMRYAADGANQKLNKKGKLERPTVMVKGENGFEAIGADPERYNPHFNLLERFIYSVLGVFGLFKENNAKRDQYQAHKNSAAEQEKEFKAVSSKITEQEKKETEKLKKSLRTEEYVKQRTEMSKAYDDIYHITSQEKRLKMEEAYFASDPMKGEEARNTDFAQYEKVIHLDTLNRGTSRTSLGHMCMIAKGYSVNDVLFSTELDKERRIAGDEVRKYIQEKNFDEIYKMYAITGEALGNVSIHLDNNSYKDIMRFSGKIMPLAYFINDFRQMLNSSNNKDIHDSLDSKDIFQNNVSDAMKSEYGVRFEKCMEMGKKSVQLQIAANNIKNIANEGFVSMDKSVLIKVQTGLKLVAGLDLAGSHNISFGEAVKQLNEQALAGDDKKICNVLTTSPNAMYQMLDDMHKEFRSSSEGVIRERINLAEEASAKKRPVSPEREQPNISNEHKMSR